MIIKGVAFVSCMIPLLIWNALAASSYTPVHIGVVLDLNSTVDTMVEACMSMALSDFYAVHSDYQTRLFLHVKRAQDQVDVASQVLVLLRREQVHGIVGSQKLTEGNFIAELGRKSQVPIISFTERGQSVSNPQNPFFVRTTPDNSNQLKALAAICIEFDWHEAVVVYEDTPSGREFFSELNKEFQVFDIRIASVVFISPLANDYYVKKQLEMLMRMQTRVFFVHMNAALGGRFFLLAKSVGMMREGYAWIVTDSIGNFLNTMDSTMIEAMEGVLGVRAFLPLSKNLRSFRERWKKETMNVEHKAFGIELNAYGLFAYDTVHALAMAAERIGPVESSFRKVENEDDADSISTLGVSKLGPKLLHHLFNESFEGLSGEFRLVDGKLKPLPLEIFNVIGVGGRTIGYWTPDRGIDGKVSPNSGYKYSTSIKGLKTIVWPGDSVSKPKGWSIPETGKLRVGIPKKTGFTEFVQISIDPLSNKTSATGFSIDIFLSAVELLPFAIDCEFMPFVDGRGLSRGTYNDLVHNISREYDVVVGDTTILADRAKYADFTLPYSESGVIMVVRNKEDKDMWVFFKPFRWDLWVTILATCIFIGIALHLLEHRAKSSAGAVRPHEKHRSWVFWFPFAVLAFPERDIVSTNWSRFVLVAWLYMSYIVMQSYTAKLSSMFTVEQLNFRLSDDIIVGYQEGSFVREFLETRLHFSKSKLKKYSSIEEIHDGMSRGSKNGGYDAIVDEIPYLKLLLHRYGSQYRMVGPTYKTDGFGFAFPRGSPLVAYFSRAILSVTEGSNMTTIEQKNFGPQYSPDNQIDNINNDSTGLTLFDFGGLFIISGSAMSFAIFCSEAKNLFAMARHCCEIFFSSVGREVLRTNSTVYHADSDDSFREQISARSSGQIEVVEADIGEGIEEIQEHQSNHAASDNSSREQISTRTVGIIEVVESDQGQESEEIQVPQPNKAER